MEQSKLIEFLLNPASYPHKPKRVHHLQTHSSHVFIASPFVYKVKKPVNLGFLDFSTLEKRKHFCEKEVELNRRLCDIYIEVEEISLRGDNLAFGKGDRTVEYAVKMKKLLDSRFLKNLLAKNKVDKDNLVRVVEKLVEFYKAQPREKHINDFGTPERIRINIDENFSLAKNFIGKTISPAAYGAIKFYDDMFFQNKSDLFRERIQKGFIKDCHGDLHLEHINLSPQAVCIYDCIEFNDRFRYIDIASDIAFLAMDLDFNGRSEFADFILSEISKRMDDKTIFEVIDFYKCYRAYVRGKVESIKGHEPEVSEEDRKASREMAKKYFRLALKYSLFGSKPAFIVIFGLIGTGKSTLAEALSRELSFEVISSDRVRKEITGAGFTEKRYEDFDKGMYSREVTERTYREMLDRGKGVIRSRKSVILDASFSKRRFRENVLNEAERLGVQPYFIQTGASVQTIKERLIEREEAGTSISDGRWEIFERFKEGFEEPDELPNSRHIVVNTDQPLEDILVHTFTEIIRKGF
ncbi:MAG TPA: AAA family ATPase [Thermodesulfobacteriota bacterium]|nr:AAA family ATPase [Thermodesulfobacteriota bacterium]